MRRAKYATIALAALGCIALTSIGIAACATNQSPRTQVDDATLTSRVKAKLTTDPEVNPFNIDVDTDDAVVRLSGKVEKEIARREAERLARNTSGVRDVINEITVGPTTVGERVSDAGLASKVKAKLVADPEINPLNIDVDADDGVITLSGRVATRRARVHAEELARRSRGVRSVRNRLEVGRVGEGR